MSFWEFEIAFLDAFILISILAVVFLIANVIRRKVGFIRKSLLPTAVVGGVIMLILKTFGLFDSIIDPQNSKEFFESITYHSLALGFIALSLKLTKSLKGKQRQAEIRDSGLITVNTYAIQGVIGLLVSTLLATTFMKALYPASGMLLPMGFGQGSGQALNFGTMFENDGFYGGISFGLTIAAIGFLAACLVGVFHINLIRRKGKLKIQDNHPEFISSEVITSPNEVPVTESIDRMTIQIVLIILVYFVTFLFIFGIQQLPIADMIKNLFWGFNFLLGAIFAVLIKQVFKVLQKSNIMTRDYPNNYLLNRISGFMFDLMIIAGIAAIQINVLKDLLVPLILMVSIGTIVSYFYVRFACNYLFPKYSEEAFLSLFGTLTGTASTGMILLREVDPKFETPAATNLVYQQFYAIALGFPLFLLIGYAPNGILESIISMAVLLFMFITFNIFLFRKKIFKKRIISN